MGSKKYAVGIDFGTESGRAVIVDIANGEIVGTAVHQYADGVIDAVLPDKKTKLGSDWALQNPMDYVESLKRAVPEALKQSGVAAEDVIGVGIDFTACTMLPTKADGTPLSALPEFQSVPNAWVKLWKHHAAQPEANRINEVGARRSEAFVRNYGGKYSSEWFFSKALQTFDEAPEVFRAADRFLEGADWIVWQMTGVEKRNECTAGYKAMWFKGEGGYPSREFFHELAPGFEAVLNKVAHELHPLGGKAGGLTPQAAKWTGLKPGTAVAIANVDAHVAVPAATVVGPGKMVMIMGTSICHMLLDKKKEMVEGMCGVVQDGIIPGLWGYEAGQSGVGDIFAWFTRSACPGYISDEAKQRGLSVHDVLAEKASKLRPGESGLLALDWWNGNRSILVDADLTGLLLGANLATPPEHIYRALIEATAFGTYKIIKAFTDKGIAIDELYACGGLPERNEMLMQIYSDVAGREIKVAASPQTPALGAAMHGAVTAGAKAGGYATIQDAAAKMARVREESYKPNAKAHAVYEKLFAEYEVLHDYFGRGANDVMKRLKRLREEARGAA
ncbi:MAG: ribulokinase [Candidatus Sumerlaeota bacterium]|nr:ribulokinase [Candidatus Sumerlaeota bacterium]